MSSRRVQRTAVRELSERFRENGYLRSYPDREDAPDSHRGYELRFSAYPDEIDEIQDHLRALEIRPGKPFEKGHMVRIPVYGREQVQHLIGLLEIEAPTPPGKR
jgi:hypothetical protein